MTDHQPTEGAIEAARLHDKLQAGEELTKAEVAAWYRTLTPDERNIAWKFIDDFKKKLREGGSHA